MKITCVIRGKPNHEKLEKAVIDFVNQTKKGTTR